MKLVVFLVNGTINFETALAFWENSNRWINEQEDTIVDFQAIVGHCDSAGLSMMTDWMRHAKWLGKPIRFIMLSALQVITKVCGMVEILWIKKSHG